MVGVTHLKVRNNMLDKTKRIETIFE